jgi:preprotein translocase SecE subunit
MADKPKTAKRLVKNPETFRERAIKAADETDKPRRLARARQASARASGRAFGPVGRLLSKLFGLPPFKLLHKPLRLLGKVLLPAYFRSSWRELRKVEWPGWRESRKLTGAVLIFAIIFGLSIAGVDYVLDKAFRSLILK